MSLNFNMLNPANPWDEERTKEFFDGITLDGNIDISEVKRYLGKYVDEEQILHFLFYAISVEADVVRLSRLTLCLQETTQQKYQLDDLLSDADNRLLLEENSLMLLIYLIKPEMTASVDQCPYYKSIRDCALSHFQCVLLDSISHHGTDFLILCHIKRAFEECDSEAVDCFLRVLREEFERLLEFLYNMVRQEGFLFGSQDYPLSEDGDTFLDNSYYECLMSVITRGVQRQVDINASTLPTIMNLLEIDASERYGRALLIAQLFPMFLKEPFYRDRVIKVVEEAVLPLLADEECLEVFKFRYIWCLTKYARQMTFPKELAIPAFQAVYARSLFSSKIPRNECIIIPLALEAFIKDPEVSEILHIA